MDIHNDEQHDAVMFVEQFMSTARNLATHKHKKLTALRWQPPGVPEQQPYERFHES